MGKRNAFAGAAWSRKGGAHQEAPKATCSACGRDMGYGAPSYTCGPCEFEEKQDIDDEPLDVAP